MKIKILGPANKGPNALGQDERQNFYLQKHPATKQALRNTRTGKVRRPEGKYK